MPSFKSQQFLDEPEGKEECQTFLHFVKAVINDR